MILLKNHALFIVDNPVPIQEALPEAKYTLFKGKHVIAVPYELEYIRVMMNFGLKVHSPIKENYDWPIRSDWTPGWWQIETANFLTLNPRGHLHSAMRTRKTSCTLWAIDYLMREGLINKCLVVAPLSSIELAWADTIYQSMPHRKFVVLHASASIRKQLLAQPADIYIINHDGVEIILPELMLRMDINAIVIDEAHDYRNVTTKKWKMLNQLVNKRGGIDYCWGLTGTPTPQSPVDAYGQCKLITPRNYAGSMTRFKMDTMIQVSQFRYVARKGSEDIVRQVLSPSIRYDRSVVTDMTPCIIERHAELSEEQKKHYVKLKKEAVTEIRGTAVTAINAAVLCGRLAQTAAGCLYGVNGEFMEIDFGPRLKVLQELIEENDEKVLVFVPFIGALEAIARELKKKWTVAVVDGGVAQNKRNNIFRAFQKEKDPHIIAAHPNTMAYSLDLTAASLVIWYAPPVTGNKIYQQACARIDGGHQKKKMDIAHISGTPEERKMYEVLAGRAKWQDVLLGMM